jgi:hypothetical protein
VGVEGGRLPSAVSLFLMQSPCQTKTATRRGSRQVAVLESVKIFYNGTKEDRMFGQSIRQDAKYRAAFSPYCFT